MLAIGFTLFTSLNFGKRNNCCGEENVDVIFAWRDIGFQHLVAAAGSTEAGE